MDRSYQSFKRCVCQSVCQACSFGARLVFACVSLGVISSFLAIITLLLTNTYKTRFQTVDPVVASSNLVGLVLKKKPNFAVGLFLCAGNTDYADKLGLFRHGLMRTFRHGRNTEVRRRKTEDREQVIKKSGCRLSGQQGIR